MYRLSHRNIGLLICFYRGSLILGIMHVYLTAHMREGISARPGVTGGVTGSGGTSNNTGLPGHVKLSRVLFHRLNLGCFAISFIVGIYTVSFFCLTGVSFISLALIRPIYHLQGFSHHGDATHSVARDETSNSTSLATTLAEEACSASLTTHFGAWSPITHSTSSQTTPHLP